MSKFKVGQKVICIDTGGFRTLTKGNVYTINFVGEIKRFNGSVCDFVGLKETCKGNPKMEWSAKRFKPYRKVGLI